MAHRLEWKIDGLGLNATVSLAGEINEDSHLADLLGTLNDYQQINFILERVSRINSIGVREWVNFMRGMADDKRLTLSRCSPAIVAQLNMIRNFSGHAKIQSVCAPYVCTHCNAERTIIIELLSFKDFQNRILRCIECNSPMEMDDFNSSYFSFLAAGSSAS